MKTTLQTWEIQLEQLDRSFWRAALANALTGAPSDPRPSASVGRVEAAQDHSEDVEGASFPIMRFQSPDDLSDPNPSADVARGRLHELDQALQAAGWERETENGEHWWSLRYPRTPA